MKEVFDDYCAKFKIDFNTLDKILYSIFKLILNERNYLPTHYDIKVNSQINKIEFINLKTQENEFSLLGRLALIKFRNYLLAISKGLESKMIDIDQMHAVALSNNFIELKRIIHSFLDSDENTNKEITQSRIEEFTKSLDGEFDREREEERKKYKIIDEHARFCPACQQRPCMCSDPDRG